MKSKEGNAGAAYTYIWLSCNSSPERLGLLELGAVCVAVFGNRSSAKVDRCYFQAVVEWWSSLEPKNLSWVDCFSLYKPL